MATFALMAWPFIASLLAFAMARIPAFVIMVVAPYMLLPEAFVIPLPGLPDIEKSLITAVGLVVAMLITSTRTPVIEPQIARMRPLSRAFIVLCLLVIPICLVSTVFANGEPLRFGPKVLPGARPWDVVAVMTNVAIFLLPFILAQRYLSTPQSHLVLLRILVISILLYTVLILVEARLSPQLHRWVYGFHQHSFTQHVRGGYRPKVFLEHGISVGFLLFVGIMSAIGLWQKTKSAAWMFAALWLVAILILSRNLGALMIAVVFGGLFLFVPARLKLIAMATVGLAVLFYPLLRQSNVVPVDRVVAFAETISEERAASLAFRLRNEDQLLDRAMQKPLTGWGGWGRSRIYDEKGRDISITDGTWIQVIGRFGFPYYLVLFGLLVAPLVGLMRRNFRNQPVPAQTMALAVILAGNLVYIIPNATLTLLSWTIVGALAGFVARPQEAEVAKPSETETGPTHSRYTRFGPPESSSPAA